MTALRTEVVSVEFEIKTFETALTSFGKEYHVLVTGNGMPIFSGWISENRMDDLRKYGRIPHQR